VLTETSAVDVGNCSNRYHETLRFRPIDTWQADSGPRCRLNESLTTTETVEIPGELWLSNPIPPSITVRLPLAARPHGLKNFLLGLLAFPIGALFAVASTLLSAALVFGTHDIRLSVADGVIFLVILPVSLFGSVFLGAALTCFWDAIHSGFAIEITAECLSDHRSGLSVPWSSVRSARILSIGGAASIDLQLRNPVATCQNPFRPGVLFYRYCPKPDHVIVPIGYLDVRSHVLAYTILTLTQWNGGEAISKMPGSAFDMGLKVIPQKIA
jgi:hypothetical protein